MQKTLLQLLQSMAVNLNGDTTAPVSGTDEYNLWVDALMQAQDIWGESDYDFPELRATYRTTILISGTSVALPDGFVKLYGFPILGGNSIQEVDPQKVDFYKDQTYVTLDMNDQSMQIYPALATTVPMQFPYRTMPTAMTTLTDRSLCPSNDFMISKASEIILFGRENARYSKFKDDADLAMAKMIGTKVHKQSQADTSIRNTSMDKSGFVLGRD